MAVTVRISKSSFLARQYFPKESAVDEDVTVIKIVERLVGSIMKARMFDPLNANFIRCTDNMARLFNLPAFHISQFA